MTDDQTPDHARRFAADLRTLRVEAGNPTLHALAASTGVSKSVISDAFAGRKLPTENTVSQLARALGADPQTWLDRRRALDPRFGGTGAAAQASAPRGVTLRATVLTAMFAAVVASGLTSGAWAIAWNNQPPAPAPNALPFETGVDPMTTACRNDAVLAAYEERREGLFVIEMLYSHNCMAAWGRVTRYDELSAGNEIGMTVFPREEPESDRTQERSDTDVQSLYTTMLIEPDVDARVCGSAWVTIDGERIDLEPAVCI